MIGILHGYLLDGSGSNLWTRSVVRALCKDGETVHLICQERHPEKYDFIARAYEYGLDGSTRTLMERESPFPGECVMHRPELGDTLPVYVWDQYEVFKRVVPMVELGGRELEHYLGRNVDVLLKVVEENGITSLHANHAVLMSVVARRVSAWTGVPYVVMPHGSALEYAVKPDARLRRLGEEAFEAASRILVISEEVAARAEAVFPDAAEGIREKLVPLDLGVDTGAFTTIEPSARPANVDRVVDLLGGLERGRTVEQGTGLVAAIEGGSRVGAAVAGVGDYVAKNPDEDVEQKLRAIDWENDQVLAFIGRLIPAKGIHAVLGALPLILEKSPRLRVLVVGHGPLRDPLEALLHAFARGDRALAREVLAHAETIDTGEPEHLEALSLFWDRLEETGRADEYWRLAAERIKPDTVQFTGYLTHREMAWLLPCCDAAIFPSMVLEAGPLVFLEALASGVFPLGTYFGGMKLKIDRAAEYVGQAAESMKIRPQAEHIVGDIARVVPEALADTGVDRATLRRIAVEHYDWQPVARRLAAVLGEVQATAEARVSSSAEGD